MPPLRKRAAAKAPVHNPDSSDSASDTNNASKMRPQRKKPKVAAKEPAVGTSDSDSGPDDVNPPPPTAATSGPTAQASSTSSCAHRRAKPLDGNPAWTLNAGGKERFISVGEFKGKTYVNLREYYEKDGKLLPGKGGIALTVDQWQRLGECVADVNAVLAAQGKK